MANTSEGVNDNLVAQQRSSNDDEIDLFELIDDIWNQKVWLFGCLFVTIILAGLYLNKATPVYQAKAEVKLATAYDLIEFVRPELQFARPELQFARPQLQFPLPPPLRDGDTFHEFPETILEVTIQSAFSSSAAALSSTDYLKAFYESKLDDIKEILGAYNDNLTLGQNFSDFSQQLSVETPGKKDTEFFVRLSLESSDASLAAMLLNEFVEYALARSLRDSYNNLLATVDGRIEVLNYEANIIRKEYFGNKNRRILELKEAVNIALAMGQENPVLVGGQLPPLYMLGSKAIKAEIKALEFREKMAKDLARDEDHFIAGLDKLLAEIEALKALEIDFSNTRLARIDQVAVVPANPIKPRKLLIMALALVVGLFVGLFMALIVAAFGKHKIRSPKKQDV
jgi:chain length determinant protein (polysaccharide antigen chain regulator)